MRVRLQALGCRLNEAELEDWARQFQERGHRLAAAGEAADLVVINTCAVTEEAVRKSRKLLRRARRTYPEARLVVSGCFATLEGSALGRDSGLDLIVANRDKDRLVEIAAAELAAPPEAMDAAVMDAPLHPLFARGRQRAFVKVQDGCRHRCAFCLVTRVRGEERSQPIPAVVDRLNRLADEGVREVVLAGVHLGGWGRDLGQRLPDLLVAILADTAIPRLRLGSLEPWELDADFWDLFEHPRLMPHLHLPLQSGADSVLRRMARRGRRADFAKLAGIARARVPTIQLTTDILVGFPGETEDEWRQTLEFAEAMAFGHIHIFPYSARPGTKAATLPDPVPEPVKQRRGRELQLLAQRMRRHLLHQHLGQRREVLIEGRHAGGEANHWFGYTPQYLPVCLHADLPDLENRLLEVEIRGLTAAADSLYARLPDAES